MSRNAGNDKYGEFDDISPKAKMQVNELKIRVPTKRQIWRYFAKDQNATEWAQDMVQCI